jgi:type I restriction enzyme R subunit
VEASLEKGHPRALVSMATGAGKTFAACALTHRLLTHARAGRVLFLVDRANLGKQAVGEFANYRPPGTGLFFTEEYEVQHLQGRVIAPSAKVMISTVQRLYAALRGVDLDEETDEHGGFEAAPDDAPRAVAYDADIPPETFDLVIVDECHRSIYGTWRQVLEYFDAFIVGLTATPGTHTLGFFQQNQVSEYPFARSVADGVNVDFEVWRIRTEVGERGGTIPAGFVVPHRDRDTRRRRLAAYDDDLTYVAAQLNRAVEVPNQIRTVLTAYRDALPTQLFPDRVEVPKTLIFCQSYRPQLGVHLQGQGGERAAGWARSRRALRAGGQYPHRGLRRARPDRSQGAVAGIERFLNGRSRLNCMFRSRNARADGVNPADRRCSSA